MISGRFSDSALIAPHLFESVEPSDRRARRRTTQTTPFGDDRGCRHSAVRFFSQDLAGANIPGGAVSVVAPPSDGCSATASRNGAIGGDLSAAGDGKIVLRANRPGTYSWCETAAPAGYYLTTPNCGTVNLSWNLSTGIILKHKKKIVVINPF
jgi:hypothetical protein